jgi:hypothetical protein
MQVDITAVRSTSPADADADAHTDAPAGTNAPAGDGREA